jgi:hypothetical protein
MISKTSFACSMERIKARGSIVDNKEPVTDSERSFMVVNDPAVDGRRASTFGATGSHFPLNVNRCASVWAVIMRVFG